MKAATWGHPVPDPDGYAKMTLPCGHLDEVITPKQVAAGKTWQTYCPVCEESYIVIVINEHELAGAGLLHREPSPGGLTIAISAVAR